MSSSSDKVLAGSQSDIDRVLVEIDEQAPRGVVNCRATLERLDGDLELFRDLLGYYFRDLPELLGEISRALNAADADALGRWAHRLKGLVSNFDAHFAIGSAHELERMGRSGQLQGGREIYERLERELVDVTAQLRRF
jgi:HPt (histidine-containing phosphotransfer) domain-containing protein